MARRTEARSASDASHLSGRDDVAEGVAAGRDRVYLSSSSSGTSRRPSAASCSKLGFPSIESIGISLRFASAILAFKSSHALCNSDSDSVIRSSRSASGWASAWTGLVSFQSSDRSLTAGLSLSFGIMRFLLKAEGKKAARRRPLREDPRLGFVGISYGLAGGVLDVVLCLVGRAFNVFLVHDRLLGLRKCRTTRLTPRLFLDLRMFSAEAPGELNAASQIWMPIQTFVGVSPGPTRM